MKSGGVVTWEDIATQVGRVLDKTPVEQLVRRRVPHAEQQRFIDSRAKRKIIRAGRRGGKTVGAGILSVDRFMLGARVLYAVPTSDQLERWWYEVTTALFDAIADGVYVKNETEHSIELPRTNQRIRGKTAWNADTLRGDYGDVLILDEFQLMSEDTWGIVGAPMLLDNNGDAVFIYTPPSLTSRSTTKAKDPMHAAKLFAKHQKDPPGGRWECFTFTSHANPHISVEALAEITKDMTLAAYQQEIEARDLEKVPGALWDTDMIEKHRVDKAPPLVRIVVGVDPTGSTTNEAGIVAAGVAADGHAYVLHDGSLNGASPEQWGARAVKVYDDFDADRIYGERNYGGDMVESTIRTVDKSVPYKDVTATRGKLVRAEPISAHYQKGRVHHVGKFPELEGEMCSYVPGAKSPNRMDALVWALTELLLHEKVYGLIEHDLQEIKKIEAGREEHLEKVKESRLIKPATNGKTQECPQCHALTVHRVMNFLKCAECGFQFGGPSNGGAPQAKRQDFLK